jgi:hypothetical protein
LSGAALPTYCPSCRAIRQPNGTFCHMCGYSFLTKSSIATPVAERESAIPGRPIGIGDGFRFGLGFMTAVVVFWIIFAVLSSIFFAGILGGILRSLPR